MEDTRHNGGQWAANEGRQCEAYTFGHHGVAHHAQAVGTAHERLKEQEALGYNFYMIV